MRQYTAACMKYAGECPAMHDPCCIAYLLDPGMFGFRRCAVEIELAGTCTRGRTVVDLSGITGKAANTSVALSVCADRFWPLLENALLHYH
jgi:Inosine-uridine nucleoside N-ribohydrolase